MEKKKLPTSVQVLLGFISVLLCIALFACSVVTILVADLSLVTSKGSLQKLVKDLIFPNTISYRIPVTAPAAIMPGRSAVRLAETDLSADAQDAIIDTLYDMLKEQFQGKVPLSKEQVEILVNESSLPEFLSDKVSGIISDVITGEVTTTITSDEIVGLLEENKDLIEDTFHIEITQDVVNSVTNWVEQKNIVDTVHKEVSNITGVELPHPTVAPDASPSHPNANVSAGLDLMDSISKGEVVDLGLNHALVMVRFITAPTVLICCIAACILLSALLFLTNWGRPKAALCYSGVTYLLAGCLFLIPSATAIFAPSAFDAFGIAGSAAHHILTLTSSVCIGVAVLGLVLIIVGAVVGSPLKKREAAISVEEA